MFEHILGNEKIKNILQESIRQEHTSHSYLFIGIEGIGKQMIAKEFAKMLLCFEKGNCNNSCKSCIEFISDNHPDFLLIEPEGNAIKIEQIRQLQKSEDKKSRYLCQQKRTGFGSGCHAKRKFSFAAH